MKIEEAMSELLVSYDAKPYLERIYILPSAEYLGLGLKLYDNLYHVTSRVNILFVAPLLTSLNTS